MNIVHLSLHNTIKDGGIYSYIKNFQDSQKLIGLNSYWITCRKNNLKLKKSEILRLIKNLNPDVIHIHGLWTIQTRLIPNLLKITKNIIIAPHGMLHQNALKNSQLKKKLALFFYERRNIEKLSFFHVLDKKEEIHIKNTFPNIKSFLIPTGITIPPQKEYNLQPSWLKKIQKNEKIILFLGRLEDQKSILELLNVWIDLKKETKNNKYWLFIAGFGTYSKIVEKLSLDLSNRIIYNGLTIGEEKEFILHLSDGFVLPSKYEGVPVSILEAVSHNCVCLISKECRYEKLRKMNSALEVHLEPKKMKQDLIRFMKFTDKEIKERTSIGMDYIRIEHNWGEIAKASAEYYKSILKEEI